MTIHKSVLLKETIDQLNLKKGDVVVDATLGGGGHSREILEKIGDQGMLIAMDLDIKAIERFTEVPIINCQLPNNFQIPIFKFKNIILINGNFSKLKRYLEILEIKAVNAIVADLGWSSDQLEGSGMSFIKDEALDMRYDRKQKLTAQKIANEYSQKDLERIIKEYGEERFWKNIAKRIVEYRKNHNIETTTQLADIVKNAIPPNQRYGKIHPATRTFQAIRIETNGELDVLKRFVPAAIEALSPGGRLGIITFHSLEDRIVKHIFRENAGGCVCPAYFPQCVCGKKPVIEMVTKKPITSSVDEVRENSRSRSAKLRVCEKK